MTIVVCVCCVCVCTFCIYPRGRRPLVVCFLPAVGFIIIGILFGGMI